MNEEEIMVNSEEIDSEKLKSISSKIVNDETRVLSMYDKLRKKVGDKMPKLNNGVFEITDFLFLLPDLFILLTRLFFDQRITKKQKVLLSCIIGYVGLPIDLLPDFIPIIGYVDDFVIVVFGLDIMLKEIDSQIIADNWSGKENIIPILRDLTTRIEKNVKTSFIRTMKTLLRTFGVIGERDSDSHSEQT